MSAPGIGSRIAERRAERSLTQAQLADLAGIHLTLISQWETGSREPCASALARLAEALGTSIDWLVTGAAGERRPQLARPTCQECRFWSPRGELGEVSHCRRRPPSVFRVHAHDGYGGLVEQFETTFPLTGPDEWCGEFASRT